MNTESTEKEYTVKTKGYCGCHPETCCCDPYKVVDRDGKTVATFYLRSDAEELVRLLERER